MKVFVVLFTVIATCCAYNAFPKLQRNSVIPPPPGNQCVNPEGAAGLGHAVRILVDMLPAMDMLSIVLNGLSNDPEVIDAMDYLQSEAFVKIITTMHNKEEFSEVMEYLCEELYFDAYYYLNSLGDLMGFPRMTRPPQSHRYRRDTKFRSGVKGLLQDLRDVLDVPAMKATYEDLLANDEYLQLAMEKIGSEEFRRIGDAIEAMPEYVEMLQSMRELGIEVDKMLEALMKFFGWEQHF